MGPSARRLLVGPVVLVVVAAVVVWLSTRAEDAPRRPVASLRADQGIGWVGETLVVRLPPHAYVSEGRSDGTFVRPEPVSGRTMTVRPGASDKPLLQVLKVGDDEVIDDVNVVSRRVNDLQGEDGSLADVQWRLSRDGLEIAWYTSGLAWTLRRGDETITTSKDGYVRLAGTPDRSATYELSTDDTQDTRKIRGGLARLTFRITLPVTSFIGYRLDELTADGQPAARVGRDREAACQQLTPTGRVSEETAKADADVLGRLVGEKDQGVELVGVGDCRGLPVVVVGVSKSDAAVPAVGPGGTPVLAYRQPGFVAL